MITDIIGKLNNTKLPKTKPLLPLFEAISNSIHSIQQAKGENGLITVRIARDTSQTDLDKENPIFPIKDFHITDNGMGFNEENYLSFQTAESQYKSSFGSKGIGRFVWLKAFESVIIKSNFLDVENYKERKFEFIPKDDGIFDHQINNSTLEENITSVTLSNFKEDYYQYSPKTIDSIARSIIDHFLIYFLLKQCPRILLIDEKGEIELNKLFEYEIKAESTNVSFQVKEKDFNLYLTKLCNTYWSNHTLHFCANQREVKNLNLEKIIPTLSGKVKEDGKSYLYQVYITSPFLDDNVNSERTGFIFPSGDEDNLLSNGEITEKDICHNIVDNINEILSDYLSKIREERKYRVTTFVNKNSPQYRPILKYKPELLEDIPPNISDSKLDVELFKRQSKFEIESLSKREEIFAKKIDDIADIDDYKQKYEKYVEEMNEIGKSKLAQYIIHRKSVIELIEYYLGLDESKNFWKEDTIHKIVFPLKSSSDEITYKNQNLWLIDERLSYHNYLASDLPFKKMDHLEVDKNDRPDIMIFNNRFALVNDEYPYQSVVIIEFKRPGRSDYTDKENPYDQVVKYIRTIRDGKARDRNGSYVEIQKDHTPFYVYILCDITPKLKEIIDDKDFIQTPDGLGYFYYHSKYRAYIEVISYKKLIKDAKDRNRILFDKLGI